MSFWGRRWIRNSFILTLFLLMFISCEDSSTNNGGDDPNPNITIADETNVISDSERSSIISIDSLSYTFNIDGDSDFGKDLEVGDILVDSVSTLAEFGYLRKVSSIAKSKDGNLVVNTEQATIPEAVNKGKINFNSGKVTKDKLDKFVPAEGVKINFDEDSKFTVFSFDYNKEEDTPLGKVTIEGHTELEMEFFFDFEWDWDLLPYPHAYVELFESGVDVVQMGSIKCTTESGFELENRILLGQFYFVPWTFMLGPVPVVFVPRIEVFVELDGTITANFVTSASENFHGRLGVRYTEEDGWNEIATKEFETDYVAPTLDVSLVFESHLGPEVALLLYGIAGPYADITGFNKVDATRYGATDDWDMAITVGVRSRVGVKVDILGFGTEWHKPFLLFEDTLFTLNNEPFGDHIYIVSPSDNQQFLIGDNIEITTSYTGDTPDEVLFRIGYQDVHTALEEPFSYTWDSEGEPQGSTPIYIESKIDGEVVSSDNVMITLKKPVWTPMDLSELGLDAQSDANDIFFINTDKGYITVDKISEGLILGTEDGGDSWSVLRENDRALKEVIMFNNLGEGIVLDSFHKVKHTTDNFGTLAPLSYGQFNQYSFQWKNIYDISMNGSGEIVAVGKDTGIPYQYSVYRVESGSGEPTGYFNLPYPNEYDYEPNIEMNDSLGVLYNVYDESDPDSHHFMTSRDGGATWVGAEFPTITREEYLYDAHILNDQRIFLVGEEDDEAMILSTDDFGLSWSKRVLTGVSALSSIQFISDFEAYITVKETTDSETPKVYHTIDGGETWEPMLESTREEGLSKVYFLGPQFGVVSGKGSTIFKFTVE